MADRILVPTADMGIRQMIEDLRNIAAIPQATVDQLAEALGALEGVPSSKQLVELTARVVADAAVGASATTALENISPDSVARIVATVDQWRQRNEQTKAHFPDELFADLQDRLPRLIRDYPAIDRFKKANHLARLTGSTADSVDIICDIRPVFTNDRTEIVGLIPSTTLRLGYECQDGVDHVLEVNLTEQLLQILEEKVRFARQKLQVIQATGNQWIPRGVANCL